MNITYFGLRSNKYTSLNLLAKGGEGEIFTVKEDPSLVIKIYNDTYLPEKFVGNAERKKKLTHMVKNPPKGGLFDQIAWPLDVLNDSNGIFVGFLMKRIGSIKSLSLIYEGNIGTRTKSEAISWSKKIKIAKNLCSVVHAVHKADHIIGDFNPLNIGINPSTLKVVLMDTDSYHIVTQTKTFRCGVGKPEYVPAEIQQKMSGGSDLKTAALPTFTIETDYFALAIHIFKLLMGAHPYTLSKVPSKRSVVKPNMEENILHGQTAFFNLPEGLTYPKYSAPIIVLPKIIQDLFIRAFITGTNHPTLRPTEEEWYDVLEDIEKDVTQCSNDALHQFPSHNQECPWCKVRQNIKDTTIAHPMTVPKTPSSGFKTPPPTYNYSSSGPSLGEWIVGFLIGIVILSALIALIYGIVGIFTGGFNNFFSSVGAGFNFILSIGIFIGDVVVWIFSAIYFLLEIFWIVIVWLWDILVWFFEFFINQFIPFVWFLITWSWDIFWFLIGGLWDGIVLITEFTIFEVLPFAWIVISSLWDGFWFILEVVWDIASFIISIVFYIVGSIFELFMSLKN